MNKRAFTQIITAAVFIISLGISISPIFQNLDSKINDSLLRIEYTHTTEISSDTYLYTINENDKSKIAETGEPAFYSALAFITTMYLENVPLYMPSITNSNLYAQKQFYYTAGLKNFFIQCDAVNLSQAKLLNYKNTKDEIEFIKKQLLHPQFTNKKPDETKIPHIGYIHFPNFKDFTDNNLKISISIPENDADNVLRKISLLYKFQDGFLPSPAFSYFLEINNIKKNNIYINQGKDITLYTKDEKQIKIPIDKNCRISINYNQLKNGSNKKSLVSLLQDYRDVENQKIFISDETFSSVNFVKTPISNEVIKSNLEFHAFNTLQDKNFKKDNSEILKVIILFLGFIVLVSTTYINKNLYYLIANIFYICIIIISNFTIFFAANMFVWISSPIFIHCLTVIAYLLSNNSKYQENEK